ncbi:MAG: hypothetical protein PHT58_00875 [Eubacteriales bacterium]|nr:hypothetical protein [Eubacteriales bacterium]
MFDGYNPTKEYNETIEPDCTLEYDRPDAYHAVGEFRSDAVEYSKPIATVTPRKSKKAYLFFAAAALTVFTLMLSKAVQGTVAEPTAEPAATPTLTPVATSDQP